MNPFAILQRMADGWSAETAIDLERCYRNLVAAPTEYRLPTKEPKPLRPFLDFTPVPKIIKRVSGELTYLNIPVGDQRPMDFRLDGRPSADKIFFKIDRVEAMRLCFPRTLPITGRRGVTLMSRGWHEPTKTLVIFGADVWRAIPDCEYA